MEVGDFVILTRLNYDRDIGIVMKINPSLNVTYRFNVYWLNYNIDYNYKEENLTIHQKSTRFTRLLFKE